MQISNRLIRSLQKPGVLGPTAEEVRALAAHMSWLLLAGPHAYKIKRPVDLGFADFSTLEKRRYFCREELRVNRRLAAEWYLEVVPICGSPEAPTLGGEGRPIEYAVKMKRFPQEARLDRVLRRGELGPRHLDGLVRQIADFHARVEVDAGGRRFGTPDAVRKPMEASFEHLAGGHDEASNGTQLERVRRWSVQQFETLHEDFLRREREGFVRECHGDLHLGNMFLQGDLAVPFLIVHCDADEATLRRRVRRREAKGTDTSEAGLAVLHDQLQAREPLRDAEARASIPIDTADARWEEELAPAVCERASSP